MSEDGSKTVPKSDTVKADASCCPTIWRDAAILHGQEWLRGGPRYGAGWQVPAEVGSQDGVSQRAELYCGRGDWTELREGSGNRIAGRSEEQRDLMAGARQVTRPSRSETAALRERVVVVSWFDVVAGEDGSRRIAVVHDKSVCRVRRCCEI